MSSSESSTDPPTGHLPHNGNHVNLRVTYLHAGNPRPPHNLGATDVETTIGALKNRLHNELLETPAPEEQRLIYQGRPLLQDGVTLREALRLEGPVGPLPYTIHIVIQPRQAASHFRPQPTANPPQPATADAALPQMPHQMTAQDAQNQAVRLHALAQTQFNMLQQQLAQLTQHRGAQPQHGQSFSATFINGQPVPPLVPPQPPQTQPAQPTGSLPTQHPPQSADTTGQANASRQPTHPQNQLQNQPRMAIPMNGLVNAALPLGQAPLPRPLSVPPQLRPVEQHAFGMAPFHPPIAIPPLAGLPLPPLRGLAPQPPQPAYPTVWLASSRNGPEAILFAPGHGFFSSNNTRRSDQVRQVQEVHNARTAASSRTTASGPAHDAQPAATGDVPPGQLALRQPAQGAPQAAPAQDAPNPNQNDDFMGLIIQRGWLFLRLYMFTYVLSEPNTWRRYLLLSLALLVCLLPRENPLNRLFGAARRHVDNLIGPPQPRPQPQPADQNAAAAAAAPQTRTTPVRGAVSTTPEEAAARILRERAEMQQRQRDANPNILRDMFYRIEQAIALFLASLVPGVGERHVAAREEQRRLEAQVQADAERDAQATQEGGSSSSPSGDASTTVEGGAVDPAVDPLRTTVNANEQETSSNNNKEATATKTTPAEGPSTSRGVDAVQQTQKQTYPEGSSTGVDIPSTGTGGEGDEARSRQGRPAAASE